MNAYKAPINKYCTLMKNEYYFLKGLYHGSLFFINCFEKKKVCNKMLRACTEHGLIIVLKEINSALNP